MGGVASCTRLTGIPLPIPAVGFPYICGGAGLLTFGLPACAPTAKA